MDPWEYAEDSERSVSRRNVVRGAAWAIPAAVVAAPLPAMAASDYYPTAAVLGVCRVASSSTAPCPSASGFAGGWAFEMLISNSNPIPIYFYTGGSYNPVLVPNGNPLMSFYAMRYPEDLATPVPESTELPPGGSRRVIVNAMRESSGGNPSATLYIAFGHTPGPGTDGVHDYDTLTSNGWTANPIFSNQPGYCGSSCTS